MPAMMLLQTTNVCFLLEENVPVELISVAFKEDVKQSGFWAFLAFMFVNYTLVWSSREVHGEY